ncbi:TMV resistance protein N, partial [Cucurbita argyrosperma subsp. sororia]
MKYDVFISFRGKDVRKNFVGFLHRELERLGLKAFVDEKEFKIRDDLFDLFKIIEESKFVIVILSNNYASSKWCLRELTKIMECMEMAQARVLPVFYRVQPSKIRNLSNPFLKKKFVKFKSFMKGVDDQKMQRKLEEIKRWKKITTRTGVVITKSR